MTSMEEEEEVDFGEGDHQEQIKVNANAQWSNSNNSTTTNADGTANANAMDTTVVEQQPEINYSHKINPTLIQQAMQLAQQPARVGSLYLGI